MWLHASRRETGGSPAKTYSRERCGLEPGLGSRVSESNSEFTSGQESTHPPWRCWSSLKAGCSVLSSDTESLSKRPRGDNLSNAL